jgi:response regulator RpfG family c-di-GMP phosphodiesterase
MSTTPLRILFVDDEPAVLQALRRMLRPRRQEWDMHFAGSGPEALALLAQAPFAAVVSDMRMPGMDGAALLGEVQRRYPQTVRVILSGHADHASTLRSVGSTHQYLAKPCDPDVLRATLERACGVRRLLADCALSTVVSAIGALPSLPSVYVALVSECEAADGSLQKVADVIGQDIAMTAQVLHLVNSAFFGRRRRISDALQAVQLLGLDTLKALVLSAHVFATFDAQAVPGFSLTSVQTHCAATSACARLIAVAEGCAEEVVVDTTIAALLHEAERWCSPRACPRSTRGRRHWRRTDRSACWRRNGRSSARATPRSAPICSGCGRSPTRWWRRLRTITRPAAARTRDGARWRSCTPRSGSCRRPLRAPPTRWPVSSTSPT